MNLLTSKISLLSINDTEKTRKDDLVVRETFITIKLNGNKLVTLTASSCDLKELACGFIFSSGLIRNLTDILSIKEIGNEIEIETKDVKKTNLDDQILTSGCGKGVLIYGSILDEKIDSKLSISSRSISSLIKEFQQMSTVFKATGGVHSAAISDEKNILEFKEDIGRHNAIDKVIGNCLLKGISMNDKIILTSGRISSEIVIKIIRAGIPVLVSRAAPTDMGITLAKKAGVTLVGFARGKKMNVYTHPMRVNVQGSNGGDGDYHQTLIERIKRLKEEKQAIILAHNYQVGEIQDIADFVGDSLDLSRKAAKTEAKIIVFCGVHFMAETAKILSPDKMVLLPDVNAGCPMADMVTVEELRELKVKYPNALVVSYVNTHVEVKAESDYCCTSANGLKVINSLPKDREIIFTPDWCLGDYIAKQSNRKLILANGYCPTHHRILKKNILMLKEKYPDAEVIVHPECTPDVIEIADKALSTNGICKYVKESASIEFIIGTETGILHRLRKENPDKKFYPASELATCPNMKLITLEKILWALEEENYKIEVPVEIAKKAKLAIDKMLAIS